MDGWQMERIEKFSYDVGANVTFLLLEVQTKPENKQAIQETARLRG